MNAGYSPCITCGKSCRGTECRACWLEGRKSALTERFWVKVDSSAGLKGCWPWQGTTNKQGYGVIWVDGGRIFAHRVAWTLRHGPIPKGMKVLHSCDNPPCQNWSHLFLGTSQNNSSDMIAKGRQAKGERSGGAKLTAEAVKEIRLLVQAGHLQEEIAAKFGIAQSNVSLVAIGKGWKHLIQTKGGKNEGT